MTAWLLKRRAWRTDLLASLDTEVPGGPRAPTLARIAVIDALGDALTMQERVDLELLVSELVTNAVRHGGMDASGVVGLQAALAQDRLRLEVCDTGPGFVAGTPAPRSLDAGGGGFGLVLLARTAAEWGVERGDDGVCVWAEFDREARAGAAEERAA